MSRTPLVSIVICTWNGLDVLPECLDSLWAQTCADFEVIVVDNGSADGTPAYLAGVDEPRLRVVTLPENLGFGGGNNAGLAQARGAYVALVNDDTAADAGWLAAMLAPVRDHPEVGMVASRLVDYHDRDRLDTVGHLLYPDGLNRGRGHLEPNDGRYAEVEEVFFPSGCGGLYRRQLLEAIGGFDARFFAYGDDTELGLRGRWAGWTCLYAPDAVMYHKMSRTSGQYSEFKAFHVERNRAWVALKCLPLRDLVLSPLYTAARFALQAYGALSGQGAAGRFTEEASAGALLRVLGRAYASAAGGAGDMWAARRRIQASAALDGADFRRLMRRYRIGVTELALRD